METAMKKNWGRAKEKIRTKEAATDPVEQMISENASSNLAKNRRLSRDFLQRVLKASDLPEPSTELDEALIDGIILCKLIEVGFDHKMPRIYQGKIKSKLNENVKHFLQACTQFNVPHNYLFQPTDLTEKKDMKKVYECILALERIQKASSQKTENQPQSQPQYQPQEGAEMAEQQSQRPQHQPKGKGRSQGKSEKKRSGTQTDTQKESKPELSDVPLDSQKAQAELKEKNKPEGKKERKRSQTNTQKEATPGSEDVPDDSEKDQEEEITPPSPEYTADAIKQHHIDHQKSLGRKPKEPKQGTDENTRKGSDIKLRPKFIDEKTGEDYSVNEIEPMPIIIAPPSEVEVEVEPFEKVQARMELRSEVNNRQPDQKSDADTPRQDENKPQEGEQEQTSTEAEVSAGEAEMTEHDFIFETDNEIQGAVYVVGSFSGWEQAFELEKKPIEETDGKYRFVFCATVPLQPGEYQYKFLVNQQWEISKKQPIVVDGSFVNNYVHVLSTEEKKSWKEVGFTWIESSPVYPDDIFVTGSFSNWWVKYPLTTMTEKDGERAYSTQIMLEPGEHQFKFIRNGEWVLSQHIQGFANENEFTNHYLVVE